MTVERDAESESPDGEPADRTVHHVEVEIDEDEPEVPFVETLAAVKGVDQTELDPLQGNLDGLVKDVLLSPPPEENQAQIEFTYEGFRVTLFHDGHAVLRDVE